ncbi:MAG: hypothetical protein R3346_03375 [Candidatus Spechtbacterales bacterium]|nr:hypothetical protein [Candidatus Spechtbacterales bacterium]
MLVIEYIWWHYTTAIKNILILFKNYSIATWHKFLIWGHLRTLFSPWHRMRLQIMMPPKNFADRVSNIITDIFIRLVAGMIRMSIIIIGLAAQGAVFLFFTSLLVLWVFWPAVVLVSIGRGFVLIF